MVSFGRQSSASLLNSETDEPESGLRTRHKPVGPGGDPIYPDGVASIEIETVGAAAGDRQESEYDDRQHRVNPYFHQFVIYPHTGTDRADQSAQGK